MYCYCYRCYPDGVDLPCTDEQQRCTVFDCKTHNFIEPPKSRESVGIVSISFPSLEKCSEIAREELTEATNPKDLIGIKKPPIDLVPPTGIIHEAMAMANGASKYGPYNWRDKKIKMSIYLGAALRHIYSLLDGEDCAEDSGVHHAGHARACLGIVLDAMENNCLIDDRPKKGKSSELIERLTKK